LGEEAPPPPEERRWDEGDTGLNEDEERLESLLEMEALLESREVLDEKRSTFGAAMEGEPGKV
jgi:hypothetical protein